MLGFISGATLHHLFDRHFGERHERRAAKIVQHRESGVGGDIHDFSRFVEEFSGDGEVAADLVQQGDNVLASAETALAPSGTEQVFSAFFHVKAQQAGAIHSD